MGGKIKVSNMMNGPGIMNGGFNPAAPTNFFMPTPEGMLFYMHI